MYGLTGTQGRYFWEKRLRRLLERPAEDGQPILLFIDGINQEPSFGWRRLLQVLQGGIFRDKVCVLLTTQTHYLEDELQSLKQLANYPTRIGVEPYDLTHGGELDQMLERHGCKRDEFSPELIELARIPRLLPLVVKLRADAQLHGEPTVSMLLWAYGRDELSNRAGRAFNELEWEEWLEELAKKHWEQIQAAHCNGEKAPSIPLEYSVGQLKTAVAVSYRSSDENYRRLSEIIEGTWLEPVPGARNKLRPRPSTINLALGAELLAYLERVAVQTPESVHVELARWLEPVAATSAAADVLAAAMSIVVAKRESGNQQVASAVVTALLHSQNVGDPHRRELKALATALPEALLDSIERSNNGPTQPSVRWLRAPSALCHLCPAPPATSAHLRLGHGDKRNCPSCSQQPRRSEGHQGRGG